MLLTIFRRYVKKYPVAVALLLLFSLLQVVGSLYLPALNAQVIDNGVAKGDVGLVWRLGAIMLVVAIAQLVAAVIAIAAGAYVSMALARDIRHDFFTQVMTFGHAETSRFGTSSLVTRSTNDVRQVQQFITMAMAMMIVAPLMAIGGLAMAFAQDLRLSWVVVVTVVILSVVMVFAVRGMVPSFRSMQQRLDAMGSVLAQQLAGARVIRAFVKERWEEERFARANRDITDAYLTVGRYFVSLFPLVTLLIMVGSAGVVWFGAKQVDAGLSNVGTVMAFLQYLMLIMMGVIMFAFLSMMVPRAEVAARRCLEVLDARVTLDRTTGTVTELPAPGSFEFDHVTFSYPGAESRVVRDISFSVQAGQSVAVIGATGCGKTTLVKLLVRLLDPTSGTIRVGGVPIAQVAHSVLSTQFGYVSQVPHVFGTSVAANLRVGNPDATDADLWEALRIAQAKDFVEQLDGGLDYQINQGGKNLSGGQRQRIAIAMALARQAPIVVFDDSFSALDTATDRRLREALTTLPVTSVIVTQRVASASSADLVIVMDEGRIVAQGTHDQLVETSTVYQEIVESQTTAGGVA